MRNFSRQFFLLSDFLPDICWEEIAEEIIFVFCFGVWPGARTLAFRLTTRLFVPGCIISQTTIVFILFYQTCDGSLSRRNGEMVMLDSRQVVGIWHRWTNFFKKKVLHRQTRENWAFEGQHSWCHCRDSSLYTRKIAWGTKRPAAAWNNIPFLTRTTHNKNINLEKFHPVFVLFAFLNLNFYICHPIPIKTKNTAM